MRDSIYGVILNALDNAILLLLALCCSDAKLRKEDALHKIFLYIDSKGKAVTNKDTVRLDCRPNSRWGTLCPGEVCDQGKEQCGYIFDISNHRCLNSFINSAT